MTYFFDSSSILIMEDFGSLSRRNFFEKINSQRLSTKCGANLPIYNKDDKLIAIRCNCGKKAYHLIVEGEVVWGEIISPKKMQTLRQLSLDKALPTTQD